MQTDGKGQMESDQQTDGKGLHAEKQTFQKHLRWAAS